VDYVEPRTGDVPHSQASSDLLRSVLPDLQAIELEDAVREVYDWYMAE